MNGGGLRGDLFVESDIQMSEISKLRWRCRRGMKELDVLLVSYLENHYPTAEAEERAAFEALLELQDPYLFGLVTGREVSADPALAQLIKRLTSAGA